MTSGGFSPICVLGAWAMHLNGVPVRTEGRARTARQHDAVTSRLGGFSSSWRPAWLGHTMVADAGETFVAMVPAGQAQLLALNLPPEKI